MLREQTDAAHTHSRAWPAAANALLLLILSGIVLAALALRPPPAGDGGVIAAVFPPWWSGRESFLAAAAAGVAVIRAGTLPSILVVRGDGPESAARLRRAGALALINPQALGGCQEIIAP
jgi:hypothetical protein